MFKAERLKIQSRLQNYRASDCFYREKRRAVKNVFQKYLGSYLSSMEVEIFKKLKRHWPTVILAVILGLLMVWPFFYFQKSLGDEYKGILNQVIDDELFYMARIKDVMDGHPTLGNAYLLEHKNQLPQQLFLPEWLLAQPLRLLNLDIVQGRILYNFILPALAFFLTYFAFYGIK